MRVFIVYSHPEPQSFNAAMFRTACETLAGAGHEVSTSNLQEMLRSRFQPEELYNGERSELLQAAGRRNVRHRSERVCRGH
jgi:putative NADPH-quinone reductase